jgi:hypothetical protein
MTSQESVQSWTDNAEPSELVSTYFEDLLTEDDYQKGDKICLFCHEMVMRSRWLKRGTVVGWEGSHRVVDNTHKIVIERLECGSSINNVRDASEYCCGLCYKLGKAFSSSSYRAWSNLKLWKRDSRHIAEKRQLSLLIRGAEYS